MAILIVFFYPKFIFLSCTAFRNACRSDGTGLRRCLTGAGSIWASSLQYEQLKIPQLTNFIFWGLLLINRNMKYQGNSLVIRNFNYIATFTVPADMSMSSSILIFIVVTYPQLYNFIIYFAGCWWGNCTAFFA